MIKMKRKVLIIGKGHRKAADLGRFITDIDTSIDVHGPLESVQEIIKELTEHNDYDMVISSVHLIDGNVFDAFRTVCPQTCVFFISDDDHVCHSVKKEILYCLMKAGCANEVKERPVHQVDSENDEDVFSEGSYSDSMLLNRRFKYRKRFLVNKGENMVVLGVDDINYISVEGNHVYAYTDMNISFPMSTTMAVLEQELDPERFFRINRKYIASIKGIDSIKLYFNSKLLIRLKGCSDDHIIVSKEVLQDLV